MARQRWWWATTVLLLIIVSLRTACLESVPPGLTHDEASNAHDAVGILHGVHRIYFPVGYGHEPLYNYSLALTTAALGQSIFTLRLTTVGWALVQIIMTAALARRWWGRRATLMVLAGYAISFWAQMIARVGLRAPTLPAMLAIAAWAYDHASTTANSRAAWKWYSITGVVLGLSTYTYMASRGMPLLFLGYLLSTRFLDQRRFRNIWAGSLLVLIVALLVAMPLMIYLLRHPGVEQRVSQLSGAIQALREGDPVPLLKNVTASLPMLLWRGDAFWLYNIAGRPGLEPLLAGIFLIGTTQAITHMRDRRHLFLLWWLATGVAPALLAPPAYNLLHAVAAMPATLLLACRGALTIIAWTRQIATRSRIALILIGLIVALGSGFESAHAYFAVWAEQRNVRVAYHHHVVALSRWLELNGDPTLPTILTTLYPGEFHDPYIVEVALRREDLDLRWVNGRWALFVPRSEARLIVETQTQPPPVLWSLIAPDAKSEATLRFRPDDLPPSISIYRWQAVNSWDRWESISRHDMLITPGDPPPRDIHTISSDPVVFAETLTLDGYTIDDGLTDSGTHTVLLLTGWDVQAPIHDELAIFIHVLDEAGNLITQDDRLAAPAWQWKEKDRFIHLHKLDLPNDVPERLWLAVGVYRRTDLVRLEIITPTSDQVQDGLPATRALIPLEVPTS